MISGWRCEHSQGIAEGRVFPSSGESGDVVYQVVFKALKSPSAPGEEGGDPGCSLAGDLRSFWILEHWLELEC